MQLKLFAAIFALALTLIVSGCVSQQSQEEHSEEIKTPLNTTLPVEHNDSDYPPLQPFHETEVPQQQTTHQEERESVYPQQGLPEILIIYPEGGKTITDEILTVRWEAYTGAVNYKVFVANYGTSEPIMKGETTGTQYTLPQSLESGKQYQVCVKVYDSNKKEIAGHCHGVTQQ